MHERRSSTQPTRSFLRSRVVLVLGVVVLGFIASSLYREYRRREAAQAEVRAMEEEIRELELQRQRLTDLLEQAETPAFVEREARLRLGLQLPGEEVLIVPEGAGTPNAERALGTEEPSSNLARWWRHLFGPKRSGE